MRIAIASGKGGTGKTTVATNLALVIAGRGEVVTYIDSDVEEPNGHLFLKPDINWTERAVLPHPVVDSDRCISCGKCAGICQYRAIIMLGETPYVAPEMCHACGGCWIVCPVDAITPADREIGVVEWGESGGIGFIHGRLKIGQTLSPPLIRKVKAHIPDEGFTIIDCPPGTSCPVVTAVHGADFVLLVTEPTPFGLNDLKLTVGVMEKLRIPYGVFVNRADIGTGETRRFCNQRHIDILASFPDNRAIAEAFSRGIVASEVLPEVHEIYELLYERILRKVVP